MGTFASLPWDNPYHNTRSTWTCTSSFAGTHLSGLRKADRGQEKRQDIGSSAAMDTAPFLASILISVTFSFSPLHTVHIQFQLLSLTCLCQGSSGSCWHMDPATHHLHCWPGHAVWHIAFCDSHKEEYSIALGMSFFPSYFLGLYAFKQKELWGLNGAKDVHVD